MKRYVLTFFLLGLLIMQTSCTNSEKVKYEVLNDRTTSTDVYNLTRLVKVYNDSTIISFSIDEIFIEVPPPKTQGLSSTIYSSQKDIFTDTDTIKLSIVINALKSRQSEIATSAESYVGATKALYEKTPRELRIKEFENMLPARESLKLIRMDFYRINGHPYTCMRYSFKQKNLLVFQEKLITWFDHTLYTIYFLHTSSEGNYGQYIGFFQDISSTIRFKKGK